MHPIAGAAIFGRAQTKAHGVTESTTLIVAGMTAGVSATAAILAVVITSMLARRREHEADWRKLKLGQYQEFILALSGVVRERATPEAHRRYADAVNSMNLVAPGMVLTALQAFQKEISYINNDRSEDRHDRLLEALIRAMRTDIHPKWLNEDPTLSFRLWVCLPMRSVRIDDTRTRVEFDRC
jgi:hypothetical protein